LRFTAITSCTQNFRLPSKIYALLSAGCKAARHGCKMRKTELQNANLAWRFWHFAKLAGIR
jgi:hypothetical protein